MVQLKALSDQIKAMGAETTAALAESSKGLAAHSEGLKGAASDLSGMGGMAQGIASNEGEEVSALRKLFTDPTFVSAMAQMQQRLQSEIPVSDAEAMAGHSAVIADNMDNASAATTGLEDAAQGSAGHLSAVSDHLSTASGAAGDLGAGLGDTSTALKDSEASAKQLSMDFSGVSSSEKDIANYAQQMSFNLNDVSKAGEYVKGSLGDVSKAAEPLARVAESGAVSMATLLPVMDEAEKESAGLGEAFSGVQEKAKGMFGILGGSTGALIAGAGLGILGVIALKTGADFDELRQQQVIAFAALLKSTSAASDLVTQLVSVSRYMPFTSVQIEDATRQMMVFGLSANQIIQGSGKSASGLLMAIGNAAAAQGPRATEALSSIAGVFGKINAEGTLNMRTLRELELNGVPAMKILEQQLNLTAAQMANIGKQAISSGEAIPALEKGMNAIFGGVMAKEAMTVHGLMTTLKDDIDIGLGNAFDSLHVKEEATMHAMASDLTKFAGDATSLGFVKALQQDMPIVGNLLNAFVNTLKQIPALFSALKPEIGAFMEVMAGGGIEAATLGLRALSDVLGALVTIFNDIPGPIATAVGVIGGLAASFMLLDSHVIGLWNDGKSLIKWFTQMWSGATASAAANDRYAVSVNAVTTANAEVSKTAEAAMAATTNLTDSQEALGESMTVTAKQTEDLTGSLAAQKFAVDQLAIAAFAAKEANEGLAASNLEIAETAPEAAGGMAALTAAMGPEVLIVAAIAVGIGAIVAGFKFLDDKSKTATASQYNFSAATSTAATSIGIEDTALGGISRAYGSVVTPANKAAAAALKFALANQGTLDMLAKQSASSQKAYAIQTGIQLIQDGGTQKQAMEIVQKLMASLKSSNNLKFSLSPSFDFTKTNNELTNFQTLVSTAFGEAAKSFSAASDKEVEYNGRSGETVIIMNKLSTATAAQVKQMGDLADASLKTGRTAQGMQEIETILTAIQKSPVTAAQKIVLLNTALSGLTGKGDALQGLNINSFEAGLLKSGMTVNEMLPLIDQLLMKGQSLGSIPMQKWAASWEASYEATHNATTATTAANAALKAYQATTDTAAESQENLNRAYVTGTDNASAFQTSIEDVTSAYTGLNSAATSYANAQTDANKTTTQGLSNVKAGIEGVGADMTQTLAATNLAVTNAATLSEASQSAAITALQNRQSAEYQTAMTSKTAGTAQLQQMRDQQTAQLQMAEAHLASTKTQATADVQANNAQVMSIGAVSAALTSQLQRQENLITIAKKYGAAAAESVAATDPTGVLAAAVVANAPGTAAMVAQFSTIDNAAAEYAKLTGTAVTTVGTATVNAAGQIVPSLEQVAKSLAITNAEAANFGKNATTIAATVGGKMGVLVANTAASADPTGQLSGQLAKALLMPSDSKLHEWAEKVVSGYETEINNTAQGKNGGTKLVTQLGVINAINTTPGITGKGIASSVGGGLTAAEAIQIGQKFGKQVWASTATSIATGGPSFAITMANNITSSTPVLVATATDTGKKTGQGFWKGFTSIKPGPHVAGVPTAVTDPRLTQTSTQTPSTPQVQSSAMPSASALLAYLNKHPMQSPTQDATALHTTSAALLKAVGSSAFTSQLSTVGKKAVATWASSWKPGAEPMGALPSISGKALKGGGSTSTVTNNYNFTGNVLANDPTQLMKHVQRRAALKNATAATG
jgi:hypothetical protein